jgi:hypothetical protein
MLYPLPGWIFGQQPSCYFVLAGKLRKGRPSEGLRHASGNADRFQRAFSAKDFNIYASDF